MKKLLLYTIILSTINIYAQGPLRLINITLTRQGENSFNAELTIAGGTPGYVYEAQDIVIGPTSATTVTLEGITFVGGNINITDQDGNGARILLNVGVAGLLVGDSTEASISIIHPTSGAENGQITITNNSQLEPLIYTLSVSGSPPITNDCTNTPSCTFDGLAPDIYFALTEVMRNTPERNPILVTGFRLVEPIISNTIYAFLQAKFCTDRR